MRVIGVCFLVRSIFTFQLRQKGARRAEKWGRKLSLYFRPATHLAPAHVTLARSTRTRNSALVFIFFDRARAIAFCGSSVQAELWWQRQEDAKPSLLSSCVHFQSIIQSSMYFAEIERSANRCHFSTEFSIYVSQKHTPRRRSERERDSPAQPNIHVGKMEADCRFCVRMDNLLQAIASLAFVYNVYGSWRLRYFPSLQHSRVDCVPY